VGQELTRHPQWESRLRVLVDSKRDSQFEWGRNDCATFAIEAIEAVTGNRIAINEPYAGLRGAIREAQRLGGAKGYIGAVERVLGPPKPASFLARGDIVAMRRDDGPFGYALGVYLSPVAAFLSERGLVLMPVATRESLVFSTGSTCLPSSLQSRQQQQPISPPESW